MLQISMLACNVSTGASMLRVEATDELLPRDSANMRDPLVHAYHGASVDVLYSFRLWLIARDRSAADRRGSR